MENEKMYILKIGKTCILDLKELGEGALKYTSLVPKNFLEPILGFIVTNQHFFIIYYSYLD